MKKLTTPKAILIGFVLLSLTVAFGQKTTPLIPEAKAGLGIQDYSMINQRLADIASAIRGCNWYSAISFCLKIKNLVL